MRAFINNDEYQGTPEEIAQFLYLREPQYVTESSQAAFAPEDFKPFEEVVDDSEALREKIANDPNYNPFGGVVASKESEEVENTALTAPFTAEENTGVEIK